MMTPMILMVIIMVIIIFSAMASSSPQCCHHHLTRCVRVHTRPPQVNAVLGYVGGGADPSVGTRDPAGEEYTPGQAQPVLPHCHPEEELQGELQGERAEEEEEDWRRMEQEEQQEQQEE